MSEKACDKRSGKDNLEMLIGGLIAQSRCGMSRPEGAFFLVWGYASMGVSWLIGSLALHRGGMQGLGWMWMILPTMGLLGTICARRLLRDWGKPFGAMRLQVAMLWAIVGPSIGAMGVASPGHPLPAQLLLAGCGIAINGTLVRWKPLMVFGIAAILTGIGLRWVDAEWQPFAFGLILGICMCIPGHLLFARKRRA